MFWTELLTSTIGRHDAILPLQDVVASFAKNAPSMVMVELLTTVRLGLMGCRLSRKNSQTKKSDKNHKLDCAPVSATADTFAVMSGVWLELWYLAWPDLLSEGVIETLQWSLRQACFHSPMLKM